jgi:DNA polymerase-3 subunit beta
MKFTCAQEDLAAALSMVQRAISNNNTLPVLNNVYLKAEGKKVFLAGTNLEISIQASLDAKVENEGALTIPSKFLTAYVPLLGSGNIEFSPVSGNALKIKSPGSEVDVKGISAEEFPSTPKLDDPQLFSLPRKEFAQAIDQVSFCASPNISRPVLTGVYVSLSGAVLKLAATDSYRLSEKELKLKEDTGLNVSFILPSKTAQELAKILLVNEEGVVEVKLTKGKVLFKVDGVELLSRLIDGSFPEYERIIPESSKAVVTLSCAEFALGIKKVALIVREANNNLRLKLEAGKIHLFGEETQLGKGSVEFQVNYQGDSVETALNAQYLLDVLSHIGDAKLNLSLNDGLSPVKIAPEKPSGYTHIIMPLKV